MALENSIRLRSGVLFDPLDPGAPVPPTLVEDALRALPSIVRYCGHVDRFYSVGEHTLWVCVQAAGADDARRRIAADLLRGWSPRWISVLLRLRDSNLYDRSAALRGALAILHDVPEALGFSDVAGPLKRHTAFSAVRDLEHALLRRICEFHGLPVPAPPKLGDGWARSPEWDVVTEADRALLGAENVLRSFIRPPLATSEERPGLPWLDLKERHVLDAGDSISRARIAAQLLRAWKVFSSILRADLIPGTSP